MAGLTNNRGNMAKKKEDNKKEEGGMPALKATRRLAMGGTVFLDNDIVIPDIIEYEILVLYLAKEWVLPVGGWQELPEPLFTDVMEKRD